MEEDWNKLKRTQSKGSQTDPERTDAITQTRAKTTEPKKDTKKAEPAVQTMNESTSAGPPLQPEQPVEYENAFELTGDGIFNDVALVACTLIFVHSLAEMVALAYVIDPAECDLNMTVMQKTLVGSAIFLGIIFTAVCWGALGDTYGRKRVMLPAVFSTVVASFISSLCTAFWSMFVMRLITGALVSASSATVLVYLGELHTAKHRDTAISYAVTAVSLTFCFVPALAWAIVPGAWSFNLIGILIRPWRVFMWFFGLFGLVGGIILIFLPESPSFVVAHEGEGAVIPILAKIYRYNHTKHPKAFPVRRLKITNPSHEGEESGIMGLVQDLVQLFQYPIRRPFFITHYCMFMVFLLANGVYLWMPGIFNLVLQDTKLPWTICTAIKSRYSSKDDFVMEPHTGVEGMDCSSGVINTMIYPMAIIMELTLLTPFIVVTIIIDKINKCFLYAGVMIPCAIGLATCVIAPQVIAAAILMTFGISSGSGASILSALAVDAFPTSLRALVMCTMYMMGQVGSVLGNTFVGIAASGPCEIIFFIMSGLVIGSILSIIFLWPDLHEVRKIMESRNFTY